VHFLLASHCVFSSYVLVSLLKNLRFEAVWFELEACQSGRGWPEPDRISTVICYPLGGPFLVVHFIGPVMKNIAISGTWSFSMPDGNITTAVVDVDRACLWMASERLNADADTEIDIYKKGLAGDFYEMEDVSPPLNDP
jgi:hypothetical protein